MGVSINSNIAALRLQRQQSRAASFTERAFERLSSGQRINSASDDAAGLAVASTLKVNSRIYSQAIRNANDGISQLNIADATLGELTGIATRLSELSEQASSGTYSSVQREALHREAEEIVAEYNRIVSSAAFNDTNVIDASGRLVRIQVGVGLDNSLAYQIGSSLAREVNPGTFTEQGTVSSSGSSYKVQDVNGDGFDDILTKGASGTFVNLNNGDGTFSESSGIRTYNTVIDYQFGDLDNDGDLDLLQLEINSFDSRVVSYVNDGNGGFSYSTEIDIPNSTWNALHLANMNSGNDLDFVVTSTADFEYLAAQGIPGLQFTGFYGGFVSEAVLEVTDLNGDGRADFLSANGVALSSGAFTWEGGFQAHGLSGTFHSVYDVDGDGNNDLLFRDYTSGALTIGLNSGSGTSYEEIANTLIAGMNSISIGDFDGDGVLDAVAHDDSETTIFRGNGDGTFNQYGTTFDAGGAYGIAGDFDGDGLADLLTRTSSASGTSTLWYGDTEQVATIVAPTLRTEAGALAGLEQAKSLIEALAAERGKIGATQSRISSVLSLLAANRENSEAAAGRILDADVALESSSLLKGQILQQVGSALAAQVNQQPELAITLLRNA